MKPSFLSVAVPLFLLSLAYDAWRGRRRKASLEAIAAAPMPALPMTFGWNGWGFGFFSAVPLVILAVGLLVVRSAGSVGLGILLPGVAAAIASSAHVGGYLRFALRGPSFVLDAQGLSFAGQRLAWQQVSSIDYMPGGRTPRIRLRQSGPAVDGFSAFDQFYGKTSVSTYFIADPDALVGWARRLKAASQEAPFA
jgi:hypothetical protein